MGVAAGIGVGTDEVGWGRMRGSCAAQAERARESERAKQVREFMAWGAEPGRGAR